MGIIDRPILFDARTGKCYGSICAGTEGDRNQIPRSLPLVIRVRRPWVACVRTRIIQRRQALRERRQIERERRERRRDNVASYLARLEIPPEEGPEKVCTPHSAGLREKYALAGLNDFSQTVVGVVK